MAQIEQHELRIVLDATGGPVGASWTTLLTSGSYRTGPVDCGPFSTVTEVLDELMSRLDIQLRLW